MESETNAHRASLEQDYAKIQNAAKIQKQRDALEKWIELHKGNVYIKVDDEDSKNCEALQKWVKEDKDENVSEDIEGSSHSSSSGGGNFGGGGGHHGGGGGGFRGR